MPVQYNASETFVDKANKPSTFEVQVAAADALQYVTDQTGPVNALFSAVAAVSLATRVKSASGAQELSVSVSLPTDDEAYRSAKLAILYHSTTTGKKYQCTIPARDPADYNTSPGTKNVILTVAAGGTAAIQTLVTDFQATVVAPFPDGGSVLIDQIVIASRNQGS
jgi:chemotaxis response regulator CheB